MSSNQKYVMQEQQKDTRRTQMLWCWVLGWCRVGTKDQML